MERVSPSFTQFESSRKLKSITQTFKSKNDQTIEKSTHKLTKNFKFSHIPRDLTSSQKLIITQLYIKAGVIIIIKEVTDCNSAKTMKK